MRDSEPKSPAADELAILRECIVQLARLALTGRPQDIQAYVSRVSRRLKSLAPDVAESLGTLVREAPTRATPLRGGAVAAVPVDQDSRLGLARVETVPVLPSEPIWTSSLKAALSGLIDERKQSYALEAAGLEPTKTALFVGPPGVGKTLAARWIAQQLNLPLITLDLAAVMSSFLGKTGLNVRNILDYGKSVPCVLLLDEIDALAKRRDDDTEIGELKRLVTVLLQQLDDWSARSLLVAATNHPDLLDPALWRRFESVVYFDGPTRDQRAELIARHMDRLNVSRESQFALNLAFDAASFSDLEQTLTLLRRSFVIDSSANPDEHVHRAIHREMSRASHSSRIEIAQILWDSGLSQRSASDLTGVSRDTLRSRKRLESTNGR